MHVSIHRPSYDVRVIYKNSRWFLPFLFFLMLFTGALHTNLSCLSFSTPELETETESRSPEVFRKALVCEPGMKSDVLFP